MAGIKGSVGRKGDNERLDVALVQRLLNQYQSQAKFAKLKVDGVNGPKTEKAIAASQVLFGMKSDFRVDPGKNTLKKLLMKPKVALATPKEEESELKPVKGTWYKLNDSSVKIDPVRPRLKNVINIVGHHYQTKIILTSGYRDEKAQVAAMYNNWPNVKGLYARINKEKGVKQKLTELYDARDFDAFKKHMKESCGIPVTQHGLKNAVDIKKSANSKIVSALRSLLYEIKEAHCYHFQLTKNLSDAQILKAKKKWK